MTDTVTEQTSTPKKPTHAAYHVREREGKTAIWTRVGSAIAHADGKGFSIKTATFPIDGCLTVRIVSEKTA